MKKIFISYRRAGAHMHTNRLFDELRHQFGISRLFMDVKSIEPGRPYAKYIHEAIASSGVVLVIIGPQWLDMSDEDGKRRLDDPDDLLLDEVQTSLASGALVMPVRVNGARSLDKSSLPAGIRQLGDLHDIELTDSHWDIDVERLVSLIKKHLGEDYNLPNPLPEKKPFSGKIIAAIVLVSLTLLAYGLDEITDTDTAVGGLFLLIAGIVLSVMGIADAQANKVHGRIAGIVTGVLGALMTLTLLGEWQDLQEWQSDDFYDDPGSAQYLTDGISQAPVQHSIAGIWMASHGSGYAFSQVGNQFYFQEVDLQNGTVTDSGSGTINGRIVELVNGMGKFTLADDGQTLSGSYIDKEDGERVSVVLTRQ